MIEPITTLIRSFIPVYERSGFLKLIMMVYTNSFLAAFNCPTPEYTMSQNPFQSLFGALLNVSNCIQTHLSQFISFPHNNNPTTRTNHYPFPLFSLSSSSLPGISEPKQSYLNPANTLLLRPAGQPPEKVLHLQLFIRSNIYLD